MEKQNVKKEALRYYIENLSVLSAEVMKCNEVCPYSDWEFSTWKPCVWKYLLVVELSLSPIQIHVRSYLKVAYNSL